jgi:hypothetical protein
LFYLFLARYVFGVVKFNAYHTQKLKPYTAPIAGVQNAYIRSMFVGHVIIVLCDNFGRLTTFSAGFVPASSNQPPAVHFAERYAQVILRAHGVCNANYIDIQVLLCDNGTENNLAVQIFGQEIIRCGPHTIGSAMLYFTHYFQYQQRDIDVDDMREEAEIDIFPLHPDLSRDIRVAMKLKCEFQKNENFKKILSSDYAENFFASIIRRLENPALNHHMLDDLKIYLTLINIFRKIAEAFSGNMSVALRAQFIQFIVFLRDIQLPAPHIINIIDMLERMNEIFDLYHIAFPLSLFCLSEHYGCQHRLLQEGKLQAPKLKFMLEFLNRVPQSFWSGSYFNDWRLYEIFQLPPLLQNFNGIPVGAFNPPIPPQLQAQPQLPLNKLHVGPSVIQSALNADYGLHRYAANVTLAEINAVLAFYYSARNSPGANTMILTLRQQDIFNFLLDIENNL